MPKAGAFTVRVHWTDWLSNDSEDLDGTGALYMYATRKAPLYIGEAGNQTVRRRLAAHKSDGVVDCIKQKASSKVGIKVGYLELEEGMRSSQELLHDIQTLLIYLEFNERGNCPCNDANTQTRSITRPGMAVINTGKYEPLVREYLDEPP